MNTLLDTYWAKPDQTGLLPRRNGIKTEGMLGSADVPAQMLYCLGSVGGTKVTK